jgi:nitrite reductase (NO-forming)
LRATGVLLVAAAAWLWRYDIATRTVRASGLTRYIALCLLAGYAWLAVGGAILALTGGAGARELWDAALHAVLLGFVFSMVFGHAPVILPAVLRIPLPYRPLLYAPLALLHATLVLRIAGDFAASSALRAWGGAGNVAAIALFILTAAGLALSSRTRAR